MKFYENFYNGAKKVQRYIGMGANILKWINDSIDRLPVPGTEKKSGEVDKEGPEKKPDDSKDD